jgi:hypothetical protein
LFLGRHNKLHVTLKSAGFYTISLEVISSSGYNICERSEVMKNFIPCAEDSRFFVVLTDGYAAFEARIVSQEEFDDLQKAAERATQSNLYWARAGMYLETSAYDTGYNAYKPGLPALCPYAPNTVECRDWQEGLHDANEDAREKAMSFDEPRERSEREDREYEYRNR